MNLIDTQSQQLQESTPYIQGLRAASLKSPRHEWGIIRQFPKEDLKSALANAWLILEASLLELCHNVLGLIERSVCLRSCRLNEPL